MPKFDPDSAQKIAFLGMATIDDVARFLGTTVPRLHYNLYAAAAPKYLSFDIPKANGGARRIEVPPKTIAIWQKQLLPYLSAMYSPKPNAHGFIPARGILSNARAHKSPRFVLNIDLENFFPSIHFGRVKGVFEGHPFNFPPAVAVVLAQLCCSDGRLPQGAATSPVLSNFICRNLDRVLARMARATSSKYTRYADDITFSTRRSSLHSSLVAASSADGQNVVLGIPLIDAVIHQNLAINSKKTRITKTYQRHEVTGLVVNQEPNVTRPFVKNVRAILRDWRAAGLAAAERKFQLLDASRKLRKGSLPDLPTHLAGKIAYLGMIRGRDDKVYTRYALEFRRLGGTKKPVVVTGRAAEVNDFIKDALWVLQGLDASGHQASQGTAFYLNGYGMVTAKHVIEEPATPVVEWRLTRASSPYDQYSVSGYRALSNMDIAILEATVPSFAALQKSQTEASGGNGVKVVGFPNWHSIADQPLFAPAVITQVRPISAITYFSVSLNVLGGASGGPVIGANGEVVGVLINGWSHAVMNNAAVDVKHLDQVIAAPVQPL